MDTVLYATFRIYLEDKFDVLFQIALFTSMSLLDNESALVHVIVWCQKSNVPV